MSQAASSSSAQSSSSSPNDDWSSVVDPGERRRIQNRIAQRKFREKVRQQRGDAERERQNQIQAAGSYTGPDTALLDIGNESGLPWGSLSLKHIVETGRLKAQKAMQTSVNTAAPSAGGPTRLGLQLIDRYARDSPAWPLFKDSTRRPQRQQ